MKRHTVTKSTYPRDHTASTLSLAEVFPLSRVLSAPPVHAESSTSQGWLSCIASRRLSWLIFPLWGWGPPSAPRALWTHPCQPEPTSRPCLSLLLSHSLHGGDSSAFHVPSTGSGSLGWIYVIPIFPLKRRFRLFVSHAKETSRVVSLLAVVGGKRDELVGGKGFLAMAIVASLDMGHTPWKWANKVRDQVHQHFHWCPLMTYWISVSTCVKRITRVSTSQACQQLNEVINAKYLAQGVWHMVSAQ